MVELEIDGQTISVSPGTSIIEAAELLDIYIPRYCYHKNLSIAANCRMCLVEVEKVGKPLPACATPVTQDMKVMTRSEKALQAQRVVLEFLLINHPLDCPVCDQGGVCELQDFAMGFGGCYSNFNEKKLSTASEDVGPLIETWMTRCIKCTRCVRFGDEVAGMRELGVVNRGDNSEISTYVSKFVDSELSGNIADICPVGALTLKPSRYQARNWELREHPSVAPHDCVGSNVFVHTKPNSRNAERSLVSIVSRENNEVNETWISDRDRFGFYGLQHSERCFQPELKHNGVWQQRSWERVLPEVVDKLRAIVHNQGAEQLAFLASPNSTSEELYLMQKLARSLGCNNIDFRLRQQDFSGDGVLPETQCDLTLDELSQSDAIVMVGSNVRFDQPMLSHRIRQASLYQAKVYAINPASFNYNFDIQFECVSSNLVHSLSQLAKAVGIEDAALASVEVRTEIVQWASELKAAENPIILLGNYALESEHAATIKTLAKLIVEHLNGKLMLVASGANAVGATHAGMLPYTPDSGQGVNPGLNVKQLLGDKPVRAYVLLNFEPEWDVAQPSSALKALQDAGLVVCLSLYATDKMREYADFILPIAPFTETAGSYVNVAGQQQVFAPASVPHGESKPAWKILRALANFLELDGFDYKSAQAVREEFEKNKRVEIKSTMPLVLPDMSEELHRYAALPMYDSDAIVRRSAPLSATNLKCCANIAVNAATAQKHGLTPGQSVKAVQDNDQIVLTLVVDESMADNVVGLPMVAATVGFGLGHGPIALQEVS